MIRQFFSTRQRYFQLFIAESLQATLLFYFKMFSDFNDTFLFFFLSRSTSTVFYPSTDHFQIY